MCKSNNTADDVRILRVSKVPNRYRRFGRRHKEQVVSFKFTPTARVTVVPQFNKIDRAFVFARPKSPDHFVLLRIDLHEGFWMIDAETKMDHILQVIGREFLVCDVEGYILLARGVDSHRVCH